MADVQGEQNLQSNLANSLNDFGVTNAKSFQVLGDLLGAIADVAGAVTGVAGFVSLVVSLFNDGPDELQQVEAALENLIQKFGQAEAAKAVADRLTNIQNQAANALRSAQSLPSLANQVPLLPAEITSNLQAPLQAMDSLAPPDLSTLGCGGAGAGGPWLMPFNFQVFWSDDDATDIGFPVGLPPTNGYGTQAPTPNADGTVFNYAYILPAYLYAVSVFLSVAAVIDPKFKQNWGQTVVKPIACLLQSIHDFILINGIVMLSPGPFAPIDLVNWTVVDPEGQPLETLNDPHPGVTPALNDFNEVIGAKIEYGAVEKFSGFSSMGIYTLLEPFDPNSNAKFLIRLLKRSKDVYVGVGLVGVLKTINTLRNLVDQAPLPGPRINDWSFRRDISPHVSKRSDGSIDLRDVVTFLESTPPTDVPDNLLKSFRDLLAV
ncbi:MAG: hypothetical protein WBX22_19370 [Silvibacterium sp.]